MITTNPERARLIDRLQVDLRKKCIHLSTDTIEILINLYDKRLARERVAQKPEILAAPYGEVSGK